MRAPARHIARPRVGFFAALFAGVATLLLTGCPHYGPIDDGTSVSYGPANRGFLVNPTRVPRRGVGFWSPPRWHQRGLRYGTDELLAVIAHTGRQMVANDRYGVVGVADLSRKSGGPSAWHRSHQTGRDVDLLFFATDADHKPLQMTSMVHFRADGTGLLPDPDKPEDPAQVIHFDTARNWRLVRTLIENPISEVQYIFVSTPLIERLLAHAQAQGEPADIILTASRLMRQPGASPHDDHFHVRIFCADSDRSLGCRDYGMLRWSKKDYKYGLTPRHHRQVLAALAPFSPMPMMMALVPVLFRP